MHETCGYLLALQTIDCYIIKRSLIKEVLHGEEKAGNDLPVSIEMLILVPLHGFGIIQISMDVIQTGSMEIPKLKAVKLTPLGKEFLSLLPAL